MSDTRTLKVRFRKLRRALREAAEALDQLHEAVGYMDCCDNEHGCDFAIAARRTLRETRVPR